MPLIPPWAPNAHPMFIHFPIVLVVLAAGVDVVHMVRPRPSLARLAATLYVLGALAAAVAYVTGLLAARVVFTPSMAQPLVESHGQWALFTTLVLIGQAMVRGIVELLGRAEGRGQRALYAAMGLVVAALVWQTAERGARLVYEQGVGVIQAPGTSN